MRLIDADKLYPDCLTKTGRVAISQSQIAEAPTDKGYQEGHIDGVLQAEKLYARPTGEWIMNKTSARGRNYTCTNCQKVSRNKFDFCPKCGADMRVKSELKDELNDELNELKELDEG